MATALYIDRDITIGVANAAMLRMWGKDESVLGKPMRIALPELEGQPFIDLLVNVWDTGTTYEATETRAELEVDGRLQSFYFNFTYKALKNSEGKTESIFHTAVDVTELVSARLKVAEAEERLSFALQASGVGIWDFDPMNDTIAWDARCRELFGFPETGEIGYEEVMSGIHPDDKTMVEQAIEQAIRPHSEGHYDVRYRTITRETGQLRWVHCKGRAYFTADHRAYRFSGTAQDITADVEARRREQQLLSLVNHNADLMSIADIDGNPIYMNFSGRALLGVPADADITRYSNADFYDPDEIVRVREEIVPKIDPKTGWQGTLNVVNRQTGEHIPCSVNYILITDPVSGQVIGRGASGRDLRPELMVRAEIQRLATIVDISEDFCNYCDIQGNTLYLNDAGKKLIGLTAGQPTGSNMFDYHSDASVALLRNEIIPELLRSGRWSGPLELVHQGTGELIPIHKQLFVIRDDLSRQPVAFAGIARDLRPEQMARKALSDKNEVLNATVREMEFMANTVPSVVWSSTPDGMLDFINRRWYDTSDRTVEETLGNRWAEAVHPDDRLRAWKAWSRSLQTGEPYEVEFRLADRKGDYRWYLVRALPLCDDQGKIVKWYGTNVDVHEQKELQRQKDNFLAVASHELKTPVTSVKAYAQVMQTMFTRSGDAKNAGLVAKMEKQVNRLNSLIEDLLDVTKINTGRLQFHAVEFDFSQLVEEIAEEVQHTSDKHRINRKLNFHRPVTGDRERISQVVTNLLTNAVKYSPDANEIVVFTEDYGHSVQLCVQDFGIGISADKKDRVFEQFYRVSGTREHTFPGLGLGLYISAEIVKHLGGKIWVNSVEGKGSTFCFSIPVGSSNTGTI